MNLPILVYDCDQCGACCRHLIIECEHADALREPRIAAEAKLMDGHGKIPLVDAAWRLNGEKTDNGFPCVFLGADNRCGIHATRPHVCVNFQAGSDQCQQARHYARLPQLTARRVTKPTILDRLHVLARGEKE